jgi:hypothetical protein
MNPLSFAETEPRRSFGLRFRRNRVNQTVHVIFISIISINNITRLLPIAVDNIKEDYQ